MYQQFYSVQPTPTVVKILTKSLIQNAAHIGRATTFASLTTHLGLEGFFLSPTFIQFYYTPASAPATFIVLAPMYFYQIYLRMNDEEKRCISIIRREEAGQDHSQREIQVGSGQSLTLSTGHR